MPKVKKPVVDQPIKFSVLQELGSDFRELWRTDERGETTFIKFHINEIGDLITYLSDIKSA